MNQLQISESSLPAFVAEFRAIDQPTNYRDVVLCPSAKLRPFAAKYGDDAVKDICMGVLAELSEGLGLPVTPVMLSDSAALIIQEWPDTKLSDFLLFKNEVLLGAIGGQIKDQLWKWNTRTIIQTWREYYEVREDVFCEERERKNDEYKKQYEVGIAKSYANASEETKQMIRDTTNNIEKFIQQKRIKLEEERPTFTANKSLNEIAEEQGIDVDVLANKIKEFARIRFESNGKDKDTMELYIGYELSQVTYAAKNDSKFLIKYINS